LATGLDLDESGKVVAVAPYVASVKAEIEEYALSKNVLLADEMNGEEVVKAAADSVKAAYKAINETDITSFTALEEARINAIKAINAQAEAQAYNNDLAEYKEIVKAEILYEATDKQLTSVDEKNVVSLSSDIQSIYAQIDSAETFDAVKTLELQALAKINEIVDEKAAAVQYINENAEGLDAYYTAKTTDIEAVNAEITLNGIADAKQTAEGHIDAAKTAKAVSEYKIKVTAELEKYAATHFVDIDKVVVKTGDSNGEEIFVNLTQAMEGCTTVDQVTGAVTAFETKIDEMYNSFVAVLNGKGYATIADAIAAANTGDTVVLIKDVTLADTLVITKSITLDLNEKTISYTTTEEKAVIEIGIDKQVIAGLNVTIENGTINSDAKYGIHIFDGSVELNGLTINHISTMAKVRAAVQPEWASIVTIVDCDIKSKAYYALSIWDTSTVTITNSNITANKETVITTNGIEDQNATVTINSGNFVAGEGADAVVYIPSGTFTINGGTFTGTTGIFVRGGKLIIPANSTAIINGTGAIADPTFSNGSNVENGGDGCNSTGDAVTIVSSNYPNKLSVTIAGGTFNSANAYAIRSSAVEKKDGSFYVIETGFISGGTFSSAPELALFGAEYAPGLNDDGTYGVISRTEYEAQLKAAEEAYIKANAVAKIGDTYYLKLQDAIDAAESGLTFNIFYWSGTLGTPIEILKSNSENLAINKAVFFTSNSSEVITISGTITGDLRLMDGKFEITGSVNKLIVVGEANVTIDKSATINTVETGFSYNITNYLAYTGKLIINSSVSEVNVSTYTTGTVTVNGSITTKITVKDGTVIINNTAAKVYAEGGSVSVYGNVTDFVSAYYNTNVLIGAKANVAKVYVGDGNKKLTGKVTILGTVTTVSVNSGTAIISGPVETNVNANGGNVTINGKVTGNVIAINDAVVTIGEKAEVTKVYVGNGADKILTGSVTVDSKAITSVIVNSGTAEINGNVTSDVDVYGGTAIINGTVAELYAYDGTTYAGNANIASIGYIYTEGTAKVYLSNVVVTGIVDDTINLAANVYEASYLFIGAEAVVNGTVQVWDTAVVDVYGTINYIKGEAQDNYFAISTNGTDGNNATINIFDGAKVVSENGIAIYLPSGNLTITGGEITGNTGIYVRGGTLNIPANSTAVITGNATTAEKRDANTTGRAYNTGDALAIDASNYPAGLKVSVAGGKFVSEHFKAVANYTSGTATELSGYISGGVFSGEIDSNLLVEGAMLEKNFDGTYSLVWDSSKIDALSDIEQYAATWGYLVDNLLTKADTLTLAERETDVGKAYIAFRLAYNALNNATVVNDVARLKKATISELNNLIKAIDEANSTAAQSLATAKTNAITEVKNYAQGLDASGAKLTDSEGKALNLAKVVVSTSTYYAIKNATTEAEVDEYVAYAKAEIDDMRDKLTKYSTETSEIEELVAQLDKVYQALGISTDNGEYSKSDIETIKADLSRIKTLLGNDATDAATIESISKKLGDLNTAIGTAEGKLESYISTNVVSELNTISRSVDGVSSLLTTVYGMLNEKVSDTENKNRLEEIQKQLASIAEQLETVGKSVDLETILAAVNALPSLDDINKAIADQLDDLNDQKLDAILKAIKDLPDTLKDAYNIDTNVVEVLKKEIADLKANISADDASMAEKLEEIITKIEGLDTSVETAKQVADAQTNAYAELDSWIDAYIKEMINSINGQEASVGGVTAVSVRLTASTISNESVNKLIDDNFNKTNAQLVKDYYQEAVTSISEATTVDDVQQAVAVFKAKVSMVQIMQTNDDELTNVYVILLVCIAVAVVAMAVSYVLFKVKSIRAIDDEDEEE
jgi:hypothetical protein